MKVEVFTLAQDDRSPREIHSWCAFKNHFAANFFFSFFLLCQVLQNRYHSLSAATDHLLDIYFQLIGEKHHCLSESSVGGEQVPGEVPEARQENKRLSLEGRELSLRYWAKHCWVGILKIASLRSS